MTVLQSKKDHDKPRVPVSLVVVGALFVISAVGLLVPIRTSTMTLMRTRLVSFNSEALRAEQLVSFLESVSLSDQGFSSVSSRAIGDPSPEEQAVQWLVQQDPLRLSPHSASDQFRLIQRYALLTLWFQQFRGYQRWRKHTGWVVALDECDWYGITCSTIDFGGRIGSQNAVSFILLEENNMYGSLPVDLGLLVSMTSFVVEGNVLSGSLPESLGLWTNLKAIHVGFNDLHGTIPPSWGRWESIQNVALLENRLTGVLPTELGHWSGIRSLYAGNNKISGTLPGFVANWTSLKHLDLQSNALSGSLCASVCNWSRELQFINLERNNFRGTIPTSINQLTSLRSLVLRINALSGTIPDLAALSNLVEMLLDQNALMGSIPATIGAWRATDSTTSASISLAQNLLTGSLPASMGLWTDVVALVFDDNLLTGTIPEFVGNWTRVIIFTVANNALTGSIASTIGKWKGLYFARFEGNNLVGSIPNSICQGREADVWISADCQSKVECDCCNQCY